MSEYSEAQEQNQNSKWAPWTALKNVKEVIHLSISLQVFQLVLIIKRRKSCMALWPFIHKKKRG